MDVESGKKLPSVMFKLEEFIKVKICKEVLKGCWKISLHCMEFLVQVQFMLQRLWDMRSAKPLPTDIP